MVSDDRLVGYIESTRGVGALSRTPLHMLRGYSAIFRSHLATAVSLFNSNGAMDWMLVESAIPSLVVTHSHVARAESLVLGGHDFVIYDQYLGQVLATVTRLIRADDPSPRNADAYLRKLYALRLLSAGRVDEAFVQAFLYAAAPPHFVPASALEKRHSETSVQESFVLAHELAHCLYRSNSDLAQMLTGFVDSQLEIGARIADDARSSTPFAERAAGYANMWVEDINLDFARQGGQISTVSEHDQAAVWQSYFDDYSEPEPFISQLKCLALDAELREEVVCDGVAVLLVIAGEANFDLDLEDTLIACLLGHHTVRLVRMLDILAAGGPDSDPVQANARISHGQTRLTFMRLLLSALYVGFSEDETPDLENYLNMQTRLNRLFGHRISDEVIYNANRNMWTPTVAQAESVGATPRLDPYEETLLLCRLPQ